MTKKRTDDLKKIKNLYAEDVLERDAIKFEKLEVALKKHLQHMDIYSTAKTEASKSYSEVLSTANDFFDSDKFNESLDSIESPMLREEIKQIIESSSSESTEFLSLKIYENPFDNVDTRIEAEREISIIRSLHGTLNGKYKRATFGSNFKNFWDDCTNTRR